MRILSNISIHRKLIMIQVVTTLLVIIFCSVLFTWVDFKSIKKNKENNLTTVTKILGQNMVAPLLFNDEEVAIDLIEDLKIVKSIQNVIVIDSVGDYFASYQRSVQSVFQPDTLMHSNSSLLYVDDHLLLKQAIYSENDLIGYLFVKADNTELNEHFQNRINTTFLVAFIAIIFAYALAFIFQKYISSPIIELESLMGKVIRTKDFSVRSPLYGKDEIGRMSGAFNKMLEQIQFHDKALKDTNNQLEQRVEERTTELKEKNQRLIKANKIAEESRLAKEQFLASMSHEIRTPLNAIIGFQELMSESELTDQQKEYLHSIDFASRNLLVIINDILDLSKIEAGKLKLEIVDLKIETIVKSVMELMDYKAKEKGIGLHFDIDSRIPEILKGDPSRLSQILLNLLSNAVKFTNEGEVDLNVQLLFETDKEVTIRFIVSDTGIGIAKENLEAIFDRFIQVDQGENKQSGTGLGLAIVKELIEIQDGKIDVKSTIGSGSTFTVTLSFRKLSSTELKQERISEEIKKLPEEKLEGLRVLLVEDIDFNQQLVRNIMRHWNCQLDIAANGKIALDYLNSKAYDVVLMDIQMPVMDGYEATQRIRSSSEPKIKNIPIIALTAHASYAEADRCLQLGMNEYLSKPFRLNDLKTKILRVLGNYAPINPVSDNSTLNEDTLFDLTNLKEHAGEDTEFLTDILQEFLVDTESKINEMTELLKKGDLNELKRLAHSLKGVVLTVGMRKTAASVIQIETIIKKEQNPDAIPIIMESIRKDFDLVKEELQRELDSLAD